MKAVVTRVTEASVTIAGKVCGQIHEGFLVLLGVGPEDTEKEARERATAADAAGSAAAAGAGDGSGAAGSDGLPVWLVGLLVLAVAAGGAFVVVFLRSRKNRDDEQAPKA